MKSKNKNSSRIPTLNSVRKRQKYELILFIESFVQRDYLSPEARAAEQV